MGPRTGIAVILGLFFGPRLSDATGQSFSYSPTMAPTFGTMSYSYAAPTPPTPSIPSPTKQPIPAPTPSPTLNPSASDTVAIAVTVSLTSSLSSISDTQKATLKTTVALSSGVYEEHIKSFNVDIQPARRRLSDWNPTRRLAAGYTWTISYTVASSLSSTGHASAEDYAAHITRNLNTNLESNIQQNLGITVTVTGVSTAIVTRGYTPVPAPTKSEDGLSAAMIAFIACICVAVVVGGGIFYHHKYYHHPDGAGYKKANGGAGASDGGITRNPIGPPVTVMLTSNHDQDAIAHFENMVPPRVDARTAKRFSGHHFSQEHFDEVADEDGTISRAQFLAKEHETGPRHHAVHDYEEEAPALEAGP